MSTIGAAAIADAGLGLNLGLGDSQFHGMHGYIAELMCYTNRLSDADFQQAQVYLARKYNLTPSTYAIPAAGSPQMTSTQSGNTIRISWPMNCTGFVLEGRAGVASGAWTPIATNPPGNQLTITTSSAAAQFYRLRQ